MIQSAQLVIEENICDKNQFTAQRMVGLEGIFGMIYIMVIISIFSYIPCIDAGLCDPTGSLEDPVAALNQIGSDWQLQIWTAVTILSIAAFNVAGLMLTQNVSSVFRAFWDATRTILVWIFSLSLGLDQYNTTEFILQFIGFGLLLGGNFIYNELVVFPCCDLNKYTRDKLDENGNLKGHALSDTDDR